MEWTTEVDAGDRLWGCCIDLGGMGTRDLVIAQMGTATCERRDV